MINNLFKQSVAGVRFIHIIKTILIFLVSFSANVFSQLAAGHDKFLGNASDPPIPATYDTYWNQLTPGNVGKWGTVEGIRDIYNWTQLDQDYNYAIGRGFAFKLHILVQSSQQPDWMAKLDSTEQVEEVEEWFKLVGERYPELTLADVVGEVTSNQPSYKKGLGGDGVTGWDWVIKAFQLARQYLPSKTKLVLLEANIINGGPNISKFIQIINLLKDKNLIDGIGLVAHNLENVDTTTLRNSLDLLATTGVDIYVHSLDIGSTDDNQQLTLYRERFPILWEHPGVKGITLWGYIQNQMYKPNGYLLRTNGTERPALSWLREYLTLPGTYRSFQSGNWNEVNTWEQYNDTAWTHPVPVCPSAAQAPIKILSGHTITVTTNDSGSNIAIASGGTLAVNSGVSFTVKNGVQTDMNVKGTVSNSGTLLKDDAAEIVFANEGKYSHLQDGGSLPIAIWREGSTVQLEGITSTAPSNGNQDFYNVVWNCPAQTANISLKWNGNTIGGDVSVISTGTGQWQMCAPAVNETTAVTIEGEVIQKGGNFTTHGTGNSGTTVRINHHGNIDVTGGNFSISRGSQGGTGTTKWILESGNFSMSNAVTENSNPSGAIFSFASKNQTLTLGTGNTVTSLPIEIMSDAALNMGTSELSGNGDFLMHPNSTLGCGHSQGLEGNIKTTGTVTFGPGSSFTFNGTSAQVTGNMLPQEINGTLTMNNSAGITLSKSITINGTLDIKMSGLALGGNQLTYGNAATLQYSTKEDYTITNIEFPETNGPKHLVVASKGNVSLHANRTITGKVELTGKLSLGDFNLTAGEAVSTASTGSAKYLVINGLGVLILTSVGSSEKLFPVGNASSYAPIWISKSGALNTVRVNVVDDNSAAPLGGRVKVKWNIIEEAALGGDYTLKFGWVKSLEDDIFKADRKANAGIFLLASDTIEAGSGAYTADFTTQPYSIARGGISALGSFAVGKFGEITLEVKEDEIMPTEYGLEQNYPNPFNPLTTIKFSLPVRSNVRLSVINMLGHLVKEIAAGNYDAGVHQVALNGSNLASGVYFYRLATNTGFVQTKKLLLLK